MDNDKKWFWVFWILILLILVASPCWGWYRAGVQQQVWEREGIHLTRWEVFTGAVPASRNVTNP